MHQFFIKIIVSLILVSSSNIVSAQNKGTIKLVKKDDGYSEIAQMNFDNFNTTQRNKRFSKYEIYNSYTFAGKSSPNVIRSYNVGIGYHVTQIHAESSITMGIITGHAYPSENYKGYTLGAYAYYNNMLYIGARYYAIPIEYNYRRLFNQNDHEDLNMHSINIGVSYYFYQLGKSTLTLLGTYHFDSNASNSYKGFYPTLRFQYNF